ncbi:MAG: glycosyltransferase [Bacteroidales bacterium]|nr:glycosyltransferase [Bacteroidales bacterium]
MEHQKIVIVSLFYYEASDNIRISTVYNLLKEKKASIELITTDFNHRTKRKHDQNIHPGEVTFLKVPRYKKNLSLGRIYSHLVFAFRLKSYLKKLSYTPSKIYCIVPTASSGLACANYCRKNKIPMAIDVIDLWPESLIILSRWRKILQFFTYPMYWMARKVYRAADLVYAGSKEYADFAQKYNNKTRALPVYLGTDVGRYNDLVSSGSQKITKPAGQLWICFGGMLGNSYDIDVILEGYHMLVKKDRVNAKLIFIGDGQERDKIVQYKEENHLNIEVTGFLDYAGFLHYLSFADIAINSFKEGTRVAYSYKFNDYITARIPIVNNVQGEMTELIEKYNLGRNFAHSADSLYAVLHELTNNPDLLSEIKKNATFVAGEVLDKKTVYQEMIQQLMH